MWSTFLFEEPSPKSELKVEKTKLFCKATMVEMGVCWEVEDEVLGEGREGLMMKSEGVECEVSPLPKSEL